MSLKDGSAFKITIEDYYTPNGKNIHGIGITPDEVVEFDAEAYNKDGTDNQLNAAIEYLTK
jgi:carboxyl-terminal processing protease